VALMNGDDCLVAADSALYRLDRSTGLREHLLDVEPDRPFNRLNDGRCDRDGRFWVGSMNRDRGPRTGALYRIAGDGRVSRMRDGIGMSNSLSFGANTMTFCDSEQGDILLYAGDLTATALPQPRVLAHVDPSQDGLADGAAMDEEGAVWVALAYGGRVLRLAPDGTVLRDMHLPVSKPTCCAFGGPDLRTLYITTSSTKLSPEQLAREPLAGSVLAVDVSVRGLPEPRWG
jgi:sugar lactone lactonase YvrE